MGGNCCVCKAEQDDPADVAFAEAEAVSSSDFDSISVEPTEESFTLPPGQKLTVMMFGMTGSGKSSLGNLVAGSKVFEAGDDTASMTNLDSLMKYEADDGSLMLLDTIGLGDTEIDRDKVVASIRDVAVSAINGVDILLFVMKNERITDDCIMRLIYVVECLWGHECLLNLYVVVTNASKYARKRVDADAWIMRQVEINWRFKHIFGLVGKNSNRFIFVDNPDPAALEPDTEERRRMSREAVMKMFCMHPRDIIPPFTHAMMKKARELAEPECDNLKAKELEVQRIHTTLNEDAQTTANTTNSDSKEPRDNQLRSPETVIKASASEHMSTVSTSCSTATPVKRWARSYTPLSPNAATADLHKAENDQMISRMALESKLKEIKYDKSFEEEADKQIELSVMKFNQHMRGQIADGLPDNEASVARAKSKAGQRVLSMLKNQAKKVLDKVVGSKTDLIQHEAEIKRKACGYPNETFNLELTKDGIERAVDCVVAHLRHSFEGTSPSEVYIHRWGDCQGINPIVFNGYCYWHLDNANDAMKTELSMYRTPEMQPKLIAALWRRADQNCDGKVDCQEFKVLFDDTSTRGKEVNSIDDRDI